MSHPKYKTGDVVNLYIPNQEDKTKATFRPVIIAEDLDDEMVTVFVTTQLHQQANYPYSFVIQSESQDGKLMGLSEDSLICPTRTNTLRKSLIYPPIRGICPEDVIDRILEAWGK